MNMKLHRPILTLAALATLSACGATFTLPEPAVGVNLTGTFVGSSQVVGPAAPGVAVVSSRMVLKASLVDVGGVITGTTETKFDNDGPTASPLRGTNEDGRVSLDLRVLVCGQTITLALKGTVNPMTRINFGKVGTGITCGGASGEVVLEAFSINRDR